MEQPRVLESWKEIAAYLKRSVATCQRWEIELGLPIHRLDGTPKARVFAQVEEVDRWKAEKLHLANGALEASSGRRPRKRIRGAAIAGASVIAIAMIAYLAGALLSRKPASPPPTAKTAIATSPDAGAMAKELDLDLGRITTSSPEALRDYFEGCKIVLSNPDSTGWRQARSLFQKAVEIDPEFAMAYSLLAITYGSEDDRKKNTNKALELRDLVSPRERLLIQANAFWWDEDHPEKAIRPYEKALKIYPGDEMVNNRLPGLYFMVGDLEKGYRCREFLYQRHKTSRIVVQRYVVACTGLGYIDKALQAYRTYLDQAPEDSEMRKRLYDFCWRHGEYELALQEAGILRAAGAGNDIEWIFPLYLMGNYPAAEQLCKDLVDQGQGSGKSVSAARDWLAGIYLTRGQLEKAKAQVVLGLREEEDLVRSGKVREGYGLYWLHSSLKKILKTEKKWDQALEEVEKIRQVGVDFKTDEYDAGVSIAKAEIYAEMGLFDKAREMAAAIGRASTDRPDPAKEPRDYHYVLGWIELKKGNPSRALVELKKERALYTRAPGSDDPALIAALASAYELSGDLEAARREREKIPRLTLERCSAGLLFAMNFYDLGKICERSGDRTKAVEYYRKFLDLWKAADPVFPEVGEAQARLVRLESR